MFRRGRSSWRFSIDLNEQLHAALFVRDALDLPVAREAAIPPRLDGNIPAFADRISGDARPDAAAEWPAWWDTLVRLELRKDQAAGDPAIIRQHLVELVKHSSICRSHRNRGAQAPRRWTGRVTLTTWDGPGWPVLSQAVQVATVTAMVTW